MKKKPATSLNNEKINIMETSTMTHNKKAELEGKNETDRNRTCNPSIAIVPLKFQDLIGVESSAIEPPLHLLREWKELGKWRRPNKGVYEIVFGEGV